MNKRDDSSVSQPNSIELSLPSRLGYEKVAMNTAASVARLMGFSDDRVEDLKTAVAEACINSIEHGNKFDETLKVGVILSMSEDSLEIKVRDQGTGASGEVHRPDIDKKIQGEESPRGLGMFLIQALVDEAEWIGSAEDGGCTRLVIHLREPQSGKG
jgi:serine/threonine-protein kinase RsbW